MTSVNDFWPSNKQYIFICLNQQEYCKTSTRMTLFINKLRGLLADTSAMYACWEVPDSCVRMRMYRFIFKCQEAKGR
jgi:hypothetical protein